MPALNFLPLPRVSHPKPPGQTDGLPTLPGPCPSKSRASFLDALAALPKALWLHRITAMSGAAEPSGQTLNNLLDTLAAAKPSSGRPLKSAKVHYE